MALIHQLEKNKIKKSDDHLTVKNDCLKTTVCRFSLYLGDDFNLK